MFKEFKKFIMRGNVVDMAVGVVIGGAFGKIVTSLVNDIIMPVIGKLTAGMDFTSLKVVLSEAVLDEAGNVVTAEAAIKYGTFIQTIVDFLIVALSIFLVIKLMNKATEMANKKKLEEEAKAKAEAEAAAAAAPKEPTEAELLAEIRDLLKNK